jgi:hypothetical protein
LERLLRAAPVQRTNPAMTSVTPVHH